MRSKLPAALRNAVLARDHKRCTQCVAEKPLAVHHITPVSEGGGDSLSNLVTLCWPCHKTLHVERGDWYAEAMAADPSELPYLPAQRDGEVFVFQSACEFLAAIPLPASGHRVLFHLMSKVEDSNWLPVTQSDIAARLGMSKSQVSKAVKELIEWRIIWRVSGTYRLNPTFAWRGTAKGHQVALAEARQKWGRAAVETP